MDNKSKSNQLPTTQSPIQKKRLRRNDELDASNEKRNDSSSSYFDMSKHNAHNGLATTTRFQSTPFNQTSSKQAGKDDFYSMMADQMIPAPANGLTSKPFGSMSTFHQHHQGSSSSTIQQRQQPPQQLDKKRTYEQTSCFDKSRTAAQQNYAQSKGSSNSMGGAGSHSNLNSLQGSKNPYATQQYNPSSRMGVGGSGAHKEVSSHLLQSTTQNHHQVNSFAHLRGGDCGQNSRKSSGSMSHHSSANLLSNKTSNNQLSFLGVASKKQGDVEMSEADDGGQKKRRLRRLDQPKNYDEDSCPIDKTIEDFEKNPNQYFEDGEEEAKILRQQQRAASRKSSNQEMKGTKKGKRRLKKGDKSRGGIDNEDYGPEASADENEGGSSQDEYESDFINDGAVEDDDEKAKEAKRMNGGDPEDEEEEYYSKSEDESKSKSLQTKNKVQQIHNQQQDNNNNDEDEEEDDHYDLLKVHPEEGEDGFRHDDIDNLFYLKYGFNIPESVYQQLYEHQRVGIKWLYRLFLDDLGGVLADDMGLGKTIQICVYLRGLFESKQITRVLVVATNSILQNWYSELEKWCPTAPQVMILTDKGQNHKDQQFSRFKKKGGVLILTYGQVSSQINNLDSRRADIIVVDEGHNVKNQESNRFKNLSRLKAKVHKIMLTGTPLQNNLMELYPIFNFVQPKLFQTSFESFKKQYVKPIEEGLLSSASPKDKERSTTLSAKLRKLYEPHFLRRTKDQIMRVVSAELMGRPLNRQEMPLKTDLVVWIPLSEIQRKIYKVILENQELQKILEGHQFENALFYLSFFKKLCQHPLMLTQSDPRKRRSIGLLMTEEQEMLHQQELQEERDRQHTLTFQGIKTRKSVQEARVKQKKQIKALERQQREEEEHNNKLKGEDEDGEKVLKSLAEMNKGTKGHVGEEEEDEEYEYNGDQMKKKLDKMSEDKRQKLIQEIEQQQQQKLKVVQIQQENVQKLHQNLALDEVLKEIKDTHEKQDYEGLIRQSSKLEFLFALMDNLHREGHRVLIFSMGKKILSIVEIILKSDRYRNKFQYRRIDGDTKTEERQQICNEFNSNTDIFCCIITTKTGGFGLNLCGADRVVMLDPDWNPANDNQAIDRAYRIGQTRDVIVYRLVTFSGIEEKIYQRQVYKKAISLQTVGNQNQEEAKDEDSQQETTKSKEILNYFSYNDLFTLFNFDYECLECETLNLLLAKDGFNPVKTPTNDKHIGFLRSLKGLVRGLTLNTNLYSNNQQEEQSAIQKQEEQKLSHQSKKLRGARQDHEMSEDAHDHSNSNSNSYSNSNAVSNVLYKTRPQNSNANYKYKAFHQSSNQVSANGQHQTQEMSTNHHHTETNQTENVAFINKSTRRLVRGSELDQSQETQDVKSSALMQGGVSNDGVSGVSGSGSGGSSTEKKFPELDKYACSSLSSKRLQQLTQQQRRW